MPSLITNLWRQRCVSRSSETPDGTNGAESLKKPSYTSYARMMCILAQMRRIQIHIDEALDDAAEAEAARRGLSKAALIRASLAHELAVDERPATDPWEAITGWLDDGPVDDLDAVIYDQDR